MNRRMWAIDVEGNGGSPPEIVELPSSRWKDSSSPAGTSIGASSRRAGSPCCIRIHGIWERDVADAPDLEDVIDDVLEWLKATAELSATTLRVRTRHHRTRHR